MPFSFGQVVGVDSLNAVALVIVLQNLDGLVVDAAGRVQLVEVQHDGVAHGDTILRIVAGGVADEGI